MNCDNSRQPMGYVDERFAWLFGILPPRRRSSSQSSQSLNKKVGRPYETPTQHQIYEKETGAQHPRSISHQQQQSVWSIESRLPFVDSPTPTLNLDYEMNEPSSRRRQRSTSFEQIWKKLKKFKRESSETSVQSPNGSISQPVSGLGRSISPNNTTVGYTITSSGPCQESLTMSQSNPEFSEFEDITKGTLQNLPHIPYGVSVEHSLKTMATEDNFQGSPNSILSSPAGMSPIQIEEKPDVTEDESKPKKKKEQKKKDQDYHDKQTEILIKLVHAVFPELEGKFDRFPTSLPKGQRHLSKTGIVDCAINEISALRHENIELKNENAKLNIQNFELARRNTELLQHIRMLFERGQELPSMSNSSTGLRTLQTQSPIIEATESASTTSSIRPKIPLKSRLGSLKTFLIKAATQ